MSVRYAAWFDHDDEAGGVSGSDPGDDSEVEDDDDDDMGEEEAVEDSADGGDDVDLLDSDEDVPLSSKQKRAVRSQVWGRESSFFSCRLPFHDHDPMHLIIMIPC